MNAKVFLALLVLIGGVLFTINHIADITKLATDKVSDQAANQLAASNDKPVPQQSTEQKPSAVEQVMPLVKQVTESVDKQLSSAKSPVATVKIYDKKTATTTTIETPSQLQAQHQTLSGEQLDEQQDKAKKFQAFYQKPERCISPATHEMRIQCGNEYMRAKIKFEQQYQQQKANK